MKIRNAVENVPVLSGVAETGEFRIRNSAKAFGILSSGLYANKIRAIIREYSCNAVDSHIEAGKADVPFDVHLPSSLEPWFAVRDYGVGLDDDQVKNIFTTYFESTKSGTDDLIGGLGLGSKSAFSYTENFTITAIKNGMKRVFTAFISASGVPSIALMGQEESDEPTGVEIRFAVEDEYDFYKFEREAQHVYKHFKLRPVVSSGNEFEFADPQYEQMDIVSGIHLRSNSRHSFAIMGNIEYPLDVPSGAKEGDSLFELLQCGLEIHFDIGDLDIQASREGLSYIPETIAAIRARLAELNDALEGVLMKELAQFKSVWEIFPFLEAKARSTLWAATVKSYVQKNYPNDFRVTYYGAQPSAKTIDVDVLEKKYNIKISAFTVYAGWGGATANNLSSDSRYTTSSGYVACWNFAVNDKTKFVVTDTKTGALARAKFHWKEDAASCQQDKIYVLSPVDKSKPMKTAALWKALKSPLKTQIFNASELSEVVRKEGVVKNASILKLHSTTKGYSDTMVWRDAGKLSSFDDATTYYYIPLKGFEPLGKVKRVRDLGMALRDSDIYTGAIYGVRKSDIEAIKELSNWVPLDDLIEGKLSDPNLTNDMSVVKNMIGYDSFYKFRHTNVDELVPADSPYHSVAKVFKDVKSVSSHKTQAIERVLKLYGIEPDKNATVSEAEKYTAEITALMQRYPLLSELSGWPNAELVADYIAMVDKVKGE